MSGKCIECPESNPPRVSGIVATYPLERPMSRTTAVLALLLPVAARAHAQNPLERRVDAVEARYSTSQPVVSYTLRVDSADLSGFDVAMRIRTPRDTVRLAMVAHPEYDDRYWRFVRDLRVEGAAGAGSAAREDSALWRVVIPGGAGVVRYRLQLPPAEGRFRSA